MKNTLLLLSWVLVFGFAISTFGEPPKNENENSRFASHYYDGTSRELRRGKVIRIAEKQIVINMGKDDRIFKESCLFMKLAHQNAHIETLGKHTSTWAVENESRFAVGDIVLIVPPCPGHGKEQQETSDPVFGFQPKPTDEKETIEAID